MGKRASYIDRFRPALHQALKDYVAEAKENDWNQTELAKRAKISPTVLSEQISGSRSTTLETLDKISILLGKTPAQVLGKIVAKARNSPEMNAPPPPLESRAQRFAREKLISEGHLTQGAGRRVAETTSTTQEQEQPSLKPGDGKHDR